MADLEFSSGSLSVVDNWLGASNESANDLNLEDEVHDANGQKRGREARLGLGAKFLPGAQSRTVFTAEQKMISKLKGKKRRTNESEKAIKRKDEDAEESRTSSVSVNASSTKVKESKGKSKGKSKDKGKSKSKSKSKDKDKEEKESGGGVSSLQESSDSQQPEKVEKDQVAGPDQMTNAVQPNSVSSDSGGSNTHTATEVAATNDEPKQWKAFGGFAPADARKRKKTRSKRKNMKKDNRPQDQKPTYLNPDADDYDPYRGGTRKSNLRDRRKKMEELKMLQKSISEGANSSSVKAEAENNVFYIDKKSRGESLDLQLNGTNNDNGVAVNAIEPKSNPKVNTIEPKSKPKGKRKYKNIMLARSGSKKWKKEKPKKKKTVTENEAEN